MTATPTPVPPHPEHVPPPIIGSMRKDGSRLMVHPADVKGPWLTRRRLVFAVLILIYVAGPFVPVGGHPSLQLDVAHRRFYFFGNTFNAQDFWMVLLLALSFVFGLLFVTAWKGRVWCGWACPQTVFLEGLYRPIERLIDGPREHRIRMASEPMSVKKAARRVVKYLAFLAVSLLIAHTAAAILVSPRELWLMIEEGPATHVEAFSLTMGLTAILVFNFTWFREQFCVVLCPYGRLQSVLQDRDTVTVTYDEPRGEPRGKLVKNAPADAPKTGDCIDCNRCVVVCPTAIDIRNGSQMECVACLQCVDACNDVMVKVKRPKGLISFSSQRELAKEPRVTVRPRLLVYAALTVLCIGTLGVSLARRTPFESNIVRPKGALPWVIDGNIVRNTFEVHLVNKNPAPAVFHVSLTGLDGAQINVGTPEVHIDSLADARVPISISVDRAKLHGVTEFTLEIHDDTSGVVKTQPIRFMAPAGGPPIAPPQP